MPEKVKKVKVLIVVAQHYNPRELWPALKILQDSGIRFDVVSSSLTIQNEENPRQRHNIKMTTRDLSSATGEDYDGLMVISGNPDDTYKFWKDKNIQRLVVEINAEDKPIAGICAAVPAISLATKGKKVSFFPLIKSRERLTMAGAILQEVGLTQDANLITGENEWVTIEWAEGFKDMLLGLPSKVRKLIPSGHYPAKIPRMPVPGIGQGRIK